MGDVIHALPALTDAQNAIPGIQFDWLVEEAFAEIPAWHPSVHAVIPVALRKWRKGIFSPATRQAWRALRERLAAERYDIILDAQGLVKSAFLGWFAHGERVGLDFRSAREGLAALAYQRTCTVNFYQHAIVRMRSLFSQALNYPLPVIASATTEAILTSPDFGISRQQFHSDGGIGKGYLVFLHSTTWASKQWPESYWQQLADLVVAAGYRVKIGGGNVEELQRAERIAQHNAGIDVLPRLSIVEAANLLANAKAAVAVDTGFGHLAAALSVPIVSIYGSTNPAYTGAIGDQSVHLAAAFPCSPCVNRECTYRQAAAVTPACYTTVSPARVWQALTQLSSL